MRIELIRLKFNDTHSYKYKPFKYCCDEIQNAFCTLWRSQMRFRAVALRSITAARF